MPKVNIYANTRPGINVETGEEVPVPARRISVGWWKDQTAQLGVGWVDPAVKAEDLDYPAETDEKGQLWQSQWIDMDRHMVNQLIRGLRKARDEAFGRDE